MDALSTALGVLMRWVHISSVVVLLGGIFYARCAGAPISPRFRKWIYTAVATLLVSGLYNLLSKASHAPGYAMWFSLKMLLVLHIFAVAFLLAKPGAPAPEAKQARWMSGIVYSGLAVLAISAWLRWISLPPR